MTPGVLARLVGLLASHRRWMAAGVLCSFLAIGANVGLVAMSAYLVSRAALVPNVAELALAITAVRVLAIGRAAFRYLERYATHAATLRILADVRAWFFAAIEPLAPARLTTHRSGDLLARIVSDVEELENFYVRVAVPPIAAALVTGLACALLGLLDPMLGLVLLAFLLLTGVALPLLGRQLSREASTSVVERRGELNALVVDQIHGLADLAALDQADAHRAVVMAVGEEVDRLGERLATVRGLSIALASLLTALCAVTVLGLAVGLVVNDRIDRVYLALVPLAAIAAFEAVQPLSLSLQLLGSSKAAARRLFELVDAPQPVNDPAVFAEPPAVRVRTRSGPALEIRGLTFAYDSNDRARPVLDNVSLSIPGGGCLALVGPSGSGKTTVVNLLLRFWDYTEGEIRIDGREIRELRAADARRLLGVVSQRVDLFDASIFDNLALADPDVTEAQVEAACRQAQLHDFVMTLPDGYDTPIGENGVALSGGQRRRLAIARTIIKDAPILVLDEATADLDAGTEERLISSLRPYMVGRTTLLISHRPAMVRQAEAVVEMRRGRTTPITVAAAG
jgi:ATP-binding cassette subfamily C protein CydC